MTSHHVQYPLYPGGSTNSSRLSSNYSSSPYYQTTKAVPSPVFHGVHQHSQQPTSASLHPDPYHQSYSSHRSSLAQNGSLPPSHGTQNSGVPPNHDIITNSVHVPPSSSSTAGTNYYWQGPTSNSVTSNLSNTIRRGAQPGNSQAGGYSNLDSNGTSGMYDHLSAITSNHNQTSASGINSSPNPVKINGTSILAPRVRNGCLSKINTHSNGVPSHVSSSSTPMSQHMHNGPSGISSPGISAPTSDRPSWKERPHVGKYSLIRTIGKGNFAKVKLAQHLTTGMEVSNFLYNFLS
ncbi:unnamed protein product [Protopolystoma xenopodis]|uniref:Protein kinase domain-containing protein n=1 Tax=Protopolystoma xenopodis TaxID=117903 RepID=A0A3S5A3D1_9PLAT|nr:unnamed protein product [Protopolystoma xenopodis]